MRAIWKYQIPAKDRVVVDMPVDAKILSIAPPNDGYYSLACDMWAEVDTEAPTEERYFSVIGTGYRVADDLAYIGTCKVPPFVWHLFEVTA